MLVLTVFVCGSHGEMTVVHDGRRWVGNLELWEFYGSQILEQIWICGVSSSFLVGK